MNIPWCLCGGRKIICGSQLSPSTVWILGTEIRSSALTVSAFTRWAILLAPFVVFHNFHVHILRSILIFFHPFFAFYSCGSPPPTLSLLLSLSATASKDCSLMSQYIILGTPLNTLISFLLKEISTQAVLYLYFHTVQFLEHKTKILLNQSGIYFIFWNNLGALPRLSTRDHPQFPEYLELQVCILALN